MKFDKIDVDGFMAWLFTEHREWFENVYKNQYLKYILEYQGIKQKLRDK